MLGDYGRAVPLLARALAIREKVLGPEHLSVAESLRTLAELHRLMGDCGHATPLAERALAICEKKLGPEHPGIAVSLETLASLCSGMGEYRRAEDVHKRALAIREDVFGPGHPETAKILCALAGLYQMMGHYDRAEQFAQHALTIRKKGAREELLDTDAVLASWPRSIWRQVTTSVQTPFCASPVHRENCGGQNIPEAPRHWMHWPDCTMRCAMAFMRRHFSVPWTFVRRSLAWARYGSQSGPAGMSLAEWAIGRADRSLFARWLFARKYWVWRSGYDSELCHPGASIL